MTISEGGNNPITIRLAVMGSAQLSFKAPNIEPFRNVQMVVALNQVLTYAIIWKTLWNFYFFLLVLFLEVRFIKPFRLLAQKCKYTDK